jgi:hypothetical protein
MAGKNAPVVEREWAALASGDAKAVEETMLPHGMGQPWRQVCTVSGNNVAGIAVSSFMGTCSGTYRSFWV